MERQVPSAFGVRWRNLAAGVAKLRGTDTAAAGEDLRSLLGRITLHHGGEHLEAELKLAPKSVCIWLQHTERAVTGLDGQRIKFMVLRVCEARS